jgi:hypothetical protein
MSRYCPACGASPSFLSLSKIREAKAVKKATAALRKELRVATTPVARKELVNVDDVLVAINAQRTLGWSMAKLSFETVEALVAEIRELRES